MSLLLVVLVGFFSGCSNLAPARAPDRVLAEAHLFGVTALAFAGNGRDLFTGGLQGDIRHWDGASPTPLATLLGHRGAVRALLPLGDGMLVSGGDDGRLILWHGARASAEVSGAAVVALAAFSGHVVSGHSDGQVRVWDRDNLRLLRTLAHSEPIVGLSAHRDRLAIGLSDAVVIVDEDFVPHQRLPALQRPRDLQFSPDGRTLAAGGWFRLQLWDVASGASRSIPTEHNGLLTALAFSPDGRLLATLGRHTDSAIRVHDTANFQVVQRLQAHELCGAALRFSPDGSRLVSASDDESVRFYRIDTGYSSSGATPSAH